MHSFLSDLLGGHPLGDGKPGFEAADLKAIFLSSQSLCFYEVTRAGCLLLASLGGSHETDGVKSALFGCK